MDMDLIIIHMKSLILLTILLVAVLSVQEIKLAHKKRTPLESKRLLDYLQRSTYMQKVQSVLSALMPHKYSGNMYSYPEVKIYNYLDAQYYGLVSCYLETSKLELQDKSSEWSLTLEVQTFGFRQKNANSPQLVFCTSTSTPPKVRHTKPMEQSSTSPMDQEPL